MMFDYKGFLVKCDLVDKATAGLSESDVELIKDLLHMQLKWDIRFEELNEKFADECLPERDEISSPNVLNFVATVFGIPADATQWESGYCRDWIYEVWDKAVKSGDIYDFIIEIANQAKR